MIKSRHYAEILNASIIILKGTLLCPSPPPLPSPSPPPPLALRAWDKDRYFAPDIAAATSLLTAGKVTHSQLAVDVHNPIGPSPLPLLQVWKVVEPYIKKYNAEFVQAPPHHKENSSVQSHKNGMEIAF